LENKSYEKLESEHRSQLLSLLNEEISQIHKEESKPGWTIWALFGGISTCIWLFINQIEKVTPNWNTISIMIITAAFLSLALKSLSKRIQKNIKVSKDNRYLPIKQIFEKSKQYIILFLLYLSIIYILIKRTLYDIEPWQLNVTYISITFYIIISIIGLLLTKTGELFVVPFDINSGGITNKKTSTTTSIIIVLITILEVVTVFIWSNYIWSKNLFTLYEFKISILICTIAILLLLTTSLKSPSHILNNLIELRRELILGVLPTEKIKKQMDFIFRGLKIEDYYSKETSEILTALQQYEKEIYFASQKVNLFYNKSLETVDINNEKKLTLDSLSESVLLHLINAANIMFSKIEITNKKLKRKGIIVKTFNKNENVEILNEISNTIYSSTTNYNDLVKNWHDILLKTNNKESSKKMIENLMSQVPKLSFDVETGNTK
jgi:hypothetical protein